MDAMTADLGCCGWYRMKCFLKHVRFMPFLLFPPPPLKPVESPDHSQPDLGEREVDISTSE